MERKTRKARSILAAQQMDELPAACASEKAAYAYMESKRWGETPCCPRCGAVNVYRMAGEKAEARFLWRCRDCKRQYTVRIGTVFEESQLPLRHWVRAFWEAAKSKNGVSALELSRILGISYKSALFMLHRVRLAMTDDPATPPKMTGTVEVDEVYVGGQLRPSNGFTNYRGYQGDRTAQAMDKKTPVVGMVQRGGNVRALTYFTHRTPHEQRKSPQIRPSHLTHRADGV